MFSIIFLCRVQVKKIYFHIILQKNESILYTSYLSMEYLQFFTIFLRRVQVKKIYFYIILQKNECILYTRYLLMEYPET